MTGRRHESEPNAAAEGNAEQAAGAGAAAAATAAAGSAAATAAAAGSDPASRRLKGFGLHLFLYFAAMIVLVPVNFLVTPDNPWFVLPMVGWGSALALHAAYAMGLFGAFGRKAR